MDCDVIALFVDRIHVHNVLYRSGQHPRRIYGDKRIIAVNFHSESSGSVRDLTADRTKTDDAKLFAPNLVSGKGFFALLHLLADIFFPGMFSAPLDTSDNISGSQEQTRENKLLYTVLICARCIEYDDAFLRTLVERDIVDSGSCSGDGLESSREFCLVKRRAADQDSFRVLHIIYKFIVSREAVCAIVGDLI